MRGNRYGIKYALGIPILSVADCTEDVIASSSKLAICNLSGAQHTGWQAISAPGVGHPPEVNLGALLQSFQSFGDIGKIVVKSSLNADADKSNLSNRASSEPRVRTNQRPTPADDTRMVGMSAMSQSDQRIHIKQPPHG